MILSIYESVVPLVSSPFINTVFLTAPIIFGAALCPNPNQVFHLQHVTVNRQTIAVPPTNCLYFLVFSSHTSVMSFRVWLSTCLFSSRKSNTSLTFPSVAWTTAIKGNTRLLHLSTVVECPPSSTFPHLSHIPFSYIQTCGSKKNKTNEKI